VHDHRELTCYRHAGMFGPTAGANRAGYDTFPRVKSPKRRKIRPARPPAPVQLPLFAEAASLIRVRPERNEWRFYRLEIWPDLFGHALLVRQWGRIGTEGRRRLEPHPDPGAPVARKQMSIEFAPVASWIPVWERLPPVKAP
jgi:predicted DNA-binding WGR domain protein